MRRGGTNLNFAVLLGIVLQFVVHKYKLQITILRQDREISAGRAASCSSRGPARTIRRSCLKAPLRVATRLLITSANCLPHSPGARKPLWLLLTISLEGLRGRGLKRKPLSFMFLLSISDRLLTHFAVWLAANSNLSY